MRGPRQSLEETRRGPSHHHAPPPEHLQVGRNSPPRRDPTRFHQRSSVVTELKRRERSCKQPRSEARRPLQQNTRRQTEKLTEI
ncbi:hypothetical protein Bca4012_036834 [Brassica carinata]|uniref:Uncharacterized protein n=1 Tax=Brassica carinata TaxID=52824 RepID=A0A8X7WDI2_BRACI|nr:hypothetical protein Bca52824_010544 [Brassica carinata]